MSNLFNGSGNPPGFVANLRYRTGPRYRFPAKAYRRRGMIGSRAVILSRDLMAKSIPSILLDTVGT